MSKKILMNDCSENDNEIILCEKYTPTYTLYLWQDKKIDWDKYELYINLNIEGNTFRDWTSALVISSYEDILTWATPNFETGKLHIYYNRDQIRIQPVYSTFSVAYDGFLRNYNVQNLEIIINKNGIYIENQIIDTRSFVHNEDNKYNTIMNIIKTSEIHNIGIVNSGCTYNKISIRKYQERGE